MYKKNENSKKAQITRLNSMIKHYVLHSIYTVKIFNKKYCDIPNYLDNSDPEGIARAPLFFAGPSARGYPINPMVSRARRLRGCCTVPRDYYRSPSVRP